MSKISKKKFWLKTQFFAQKKFLDLELFKFFRKNLRTRVFSRFDLKTIIKLQFLHMGNIHYFSVYSMCKCG